MQLDKKYFNFFFAVLLCLSITLPTVLQLVKLLVLLVTLYFAFGILVSNKNLISLAAVGWSFFFCFVGLAWAVYGLLNDNPGALPTVTVMVIYPLLFPLLAYVFVDEDKKSLDNLLLLCAILLIIFDFIFLVSDYFFSGNFFVTFVYSVYTDVAVIDSGQDYYKFTIPNISSIVFLLPYFTVRLVSSADSKKLLAVVVFFLSIIALLSGRRALFVAPVCGVIIAYLLSRKDSENSKSYSYSSSAVVVLIAYGIYYSIENFTGVEFFLSQVNSILDFNDNLSNIERRNQLYYLLDGVYKAPIFGAGAGASVDYSRSVEQPWAYELSYVAFLFQYGLIGFLLYSLGILFLLKILIDGFRRQGRSSFEFAYFAGFLSFLIANATNPYLAKFDYMWVIFIPFAIYNARARNFNEQ